MALSISHPVEAGQEYRDHEVPGTVEVERLFIDEDGQTQVRIEIQAGREQNRLTVDAGTFIERIFNGELELTEQADYREA